MNDEHSCWWWFKAKAAYGEEKAEHEGHWATAQQEKEETQGKKAEKCNFLI